MKWINIFLLTFCLIWTSCKEYSLDLRVKNRLGTNVEVAFSQCGEHELNLEVMAKETSIVQKIQLKPKKCDGKFQLTAKAGELNSSESCYFPHDMESTTVEVIKVGNGIKIYCDAN